MVRPQTQFFGTLARCKGTGVASPGFTDTFVAARPFTALVIAARTRFRVLDAGVLPLPVWLVCRPASVPKAVGGKTKGSGAPKDPGPLSVPTAAGS